MMESRMLARLGCTFLEEAVLAVLSEEWSDTKTPLGHGEITKRLGISSVAITDGILERLEKAEAVIQDSERTGRQWRRWSINPLEYTWQR